MEKIRQKTIVDQVMHHIKSLIADGVYAPGDKIPTEQELAAQFGVGRSSIREAIKIFNYLGVMQSLSSRGTYIRERSNISSEALTWALLLGDDDINEVIEVRGALELWSFFQLTVRRNSDPKAAEGVLEKLRTELGRMEDAAKGGRQQDLIKADYDFHFHIIKEGGNRLFSELYQVLRSFMLHEIEETQMKYTTQRRIFEEHTALLEAIESGDILKAQFAFIDHINNIKTLLQQRHDTT